MFELYTEDITRNFVHVIKKSYTSPLLKILFHLVPCFACV